MPFLADLAWRDLRASGRSLWVFCACLVLGVALVAASGGLHRLIAEGLLSDTRLLLGGDLEIDVDEPLPGNVLDWIRDNGDVSLLIEIDTMLGTASDDFLRVELQTTDDNYPLYGELRLEPDRSLADITAFADGHWGVAIDPVLADSLSIGLGDTVYIGSLEMIVRGLILYQPDRSLSAEWRGAPVLLRRAAVDEAGLTGRGSRLDYEYRVRTDEAADAWEDRFYAEFPDAAWEIRTFEDRSRRIAERLGQIASGLMIIGFSTLFIGGLGVFNSIHAYLRDKLATIATLRSLGLRDRRLAAVYLLQVGMLAGGASLVGAAIGGGLALSGAAVVAARVPIATTLSSALLPAAIAWAFGVLTAFAFALPAIGRALAVSPAALFRGDVVAGVRAPRAWRVAASACAAAIVALTLAELPDPAFGFGFIALVGILLLVLDMVVRGIRRIAQRLDDHPALTRRFEWRLAIANLHRPGTPLRASLLSLGSALTLLVACTLVVAALVRAINATIPEESPALVLYDIGDHQLDAVRSVIEEHPGTQRIDTTPLVRSRITAVNGVPLADLGKIPEDRRKRSAREEYDLSYSANNIDDVTLTAGDWWQETEDGRPRMAVEDREAEQLALEVGDVVTFAIEGRSLDVETAAIFSQKGIQTRFWFEAILSDGALDGLVYRHVGAAYMDDEAAVRVQRSIGRIAPNVVTVRTASLLASARDVLGKAAAGLAVVAGVSLAASLLVLVSVMAAGRARQVYDATILHSLGTRLDAIRRSLHLEYLLLGMVTSLFAVILGSTIALALLEWRLKLPSQDLLWLGAITALMVSGLSLGLGARYMARRLRLSPAILLRGRAGQESAP